VQTFIQPNRQRVSAHTLGVRVMLLTEHPDGQSARRLASYGSLTDACDDLDTAVAMVLEDPLGYDLFVMDCDGFGGVAAAEKAIAALIAGGARIRLMLISSEFDVPVYPLGRRTAVCLPQDVADESFRIGFDHVLRDRAALTMN